MKAQSNYKSVLKSYISFLKQNKLYDKKKNFYMKIILKNFKIGLKQISKKNCHGI